MKKLLLFIAPLILFMSCSKDLTESCKYPAKIVQGADQFTNKTKELFLNFDYPYGLYPVLYHIENIDNPIEIGSTADDIFEQLCKDKQTYPDFKKIGVLFVVSKNPELIQVRIGKKYEAYCNLTGVTAGEEYVNLQLNIGKNGVDNTLNYFQKYISQRADEFNSLPTKNKVRLNGLFNTVNSALDFIGTPSQNLYGKFFLKPVVSLFSRIHSFVKNWFWTIFFTFAFIYLIRYGIEKLLEKTLKPHPITLKLCQLGLKGIFGLLFPITAAGAACLLSKGRLEDFMALQSLGIPHIEDLATDPANFTKSSSTLLVCVFSILWTLKMCINDNFFFSLFPAEVQQRAYKNLNDFQKGMLQVEDDNEVPFTSYVAGKMIPDVCATMISLTIAAYFFLPKVILWICIAIALYNVLTNGYSYIKIYNTNVKNPEVKTESFIRLLINIGIMAFVSLLLFVFTPKSNPMPLKENVDYSTVKTEVIDTSFLDGNYTFKTSSGEKTAYSSAILKRIDKNKFHLQVNTQTDPLSYELTFIPESFSFNCIELGTGIINYNKDLNSIKIKFQLNQQTKWELSK
jgi:hypothetical protein